MRTFACLLFITLARISATAELPGKAFPVPAVRFAVDLFQKLNPNIVWDPTNFLVDLSGPYTTCSRRGLNGFFRVAEKTKAGGSIGGLVDTIQTSGIWAEAATSDIRKVLPSWLNLAPFRGQIKNAKAFGCSVSPGCSGITVIGCIFSPAFNGGSNPADEPDASQNALAFTKNQYDIAEQITGTEWDNSHFLENLSGFETDCKMVTATDWPFAKARFETARRGMRINELYGARLATGSIDDDIAALLATFKFIPSKKVGCSVILNCPVDGRKYRVVSCLYQE